MSWISNEERVRWNRLERAAVAVSEYLNGRDTLESVGRLLATGGAGEIARTALRELGDPDADAPLFTKPTLPLGRELDMWLAEQAMGWEREPTEAAMARTTGLHFRFRRPDGSCLSPGEWRPSESIVDAWAVAEKLGIVVTPLKPGDPSLGYRARHGDWQGFVPPPEVIKPTAPEAIALAAQEIIQRQHEEKGNG